MLSLFNQEMKKFFKNKTIIASIIILFLFSVLCVFVGNMTSISTVFDMQYYLLVDFGRFLILPIFVTMTSYVYSMELECKTLKILRIKNVMAWKVYVSKFVVAAIYVFIVLLIIYVVPYLNTAKYAIETINLKTSAVKINSVIDSLSFVTVLYIRQFFAYLFVVAFVLFLAIKTQNKVIPIVGEIIFTLLSTTLNGINSYGFKFISLILPLNSENIYNEYITGTVNKRLISLLFYTIVLSIISIYIYKNKEVKV